MEDRQKNILVFALGIFSVILVVTNINSCAALRKQEQKWRNEMAQRLDSEEKAQKTGQELAALSGRLDKTRETLLQNTQQLEAAKKALMQEQLVNQNLKEELGKVNRLKDALEEDLKDALVKNGKAAKKSRKDSR